MICDEVRDLIVGTHDRQERTNAIRSMLMAHGKLLGVSERTTNWYVLDGRLYCDLSHTQIDVSDYMEACERYRRVDGRLPWESLRVYENGSR